jgi:hypothetical protein
MASAPTRAFKTSWAVSVSKTEPVTRPAPTATFHPEGSQSGVREADVSLAATEWTTAGPERELLIDLPAAAD